MRARMRWTTAAAVAALLLTPAMASAADEPPATPAPAEDGQLSAAVVAQIRSITEEKASRTPAERKVESHLLYAARRATGRSTMADVPARASAVASAADGRTDVDITATVSDRLLDRIEALGGTVLTTVASYDAIRARIPLTAVAPLSQDTAVRSIGPAEQAMTNSIEGITGALGAVVGTEPGTTNAGAADSEGDATHQADDARATFGVDGTGVTIGVLSNGVDSLAARQASGDLPAVGVVPGQGGTGDEGTAMLEIVHDLAPGATLLFATAFPTQAQMATNIVALRTAGADIIVDDITYFAEAVFQPGVIEQAVDQVVADGALYFSSAGNSGNLVDDTSGTWTGDFVSAGAATGVLTGAGELLDWDPGAGVSSRIELAQTTGPRIGLTWNDPLGASGNDYDIYVLNATGNAILDAATTAQDGDDDPLELLAQSFAGEKLVVAKFAGADRYLSVVTNRGRFTAFGTGGASYGHNSGASTISVAATPADAAFLTGHPTGPFPGPFTNASVSELFSSDGPRRNFFESDGTPIAGGEVLTKPDLTAADGVTTTTPGFNPFFGTSAAAPHAAAIAALMMEANPSATSTELRSALLASTIDIEAVGADDVTGTGVLLADTAVTAVSTTGAVQFTGPTFVGNEDGGSVTISISRTGGADGAASVQVALDAPPGTADEGTDFTYAATQTVNWADGDSATKTVSIPMIDDVLIEGTETVSLKLQNATTAVLGSPALTTLSIIDDEAPPVPGSVGFSPSTYATGEVGPTATLTVTRIGGADGAASVEVALAPGGSATNGSDFSYASPQTVSWADGEMGPRTVTVAITQDTVGEPDETADFALQNPTTAALGTPSTATLTIFDDDTGPTAPFPPPPTPEPPEEPEPAPNRDVVRIAGEDRIATAIAASQQAWAPGTASVVVLARSDGFADALVGVPLAQAGNGPLLLTGGAGLDPRVLTEIQRVLASGGSVRVLGGTAALGPAIDAALTGAGLTHDRLAGPTRFDTAVAVANALGSPLDVYLATGRNFPDALAAGAAAAHDSGVVLLTDDEAIPARVADYLDDPNVHIVAVGGPADRAFPSAEGIAGADRYATAVLLAQRVFGPITVAGLATGEDFPDALSGGAHIAHHGGPLLLTPRRALDPGVADYLGDRDPSTVYLYGGTAALSNEVGEGAAQA